jgi:CheY-like chemotaxis protein
MISMRVLIVEDDRNVRYIFTRFIGELTSRIAESDTLQGAIALVNEEEFDVILLDLALLDAGKDETLSAIPMLKQHAPVVVVTGIPDPTIEKQAMDAGADFVIPKGDMFHKSKAILLALHAAVVRKPRAHPGDDYLHHVSMLEKLVHSAA